MNATRDLVGIRQQRSMRRQAGQEPAVDRVQLQDMATGERAQARAQS
ncbi:hypothetical protein [Streptomyces albospinus]